jgi:PII-like signaling protein
MNTLEMWALVIRIKRNDTFNGKRVHNMVLDTLKNGKISGATVWTGVAGYGKRRKSNFQVEGISVNMPLVIEVIDELQKIETVLSEIKEIIGDNGLITLNKVGVV